MCSPVGRLGWAGGGGRAVDSGSVWGEHVAQNTFFPELGHPRARGTTDSSWVWKYVKKPLQLPTKAPAPAYSKHFYSIISPGANQKIVSLREKLKAMGAI